jgi:hypothetical protein
MTGILRSLFWVSLFLACLAYVNDGPEYAGGLLRVSAISFLLCALGRGLTRADGLAWRAALAELKAVPRQLVMMKDLTYWALLVAAGLTIYRLRGAKLSMSVVVPALVELFHSFLVAYCVLLVARYAWRFVRHGASELLVGSLAVLGIISAIWGTHSASVWVPVVLGVTYALAFLRACLGSREFTRAELPAESEDPAFVAFSLAPRYLVGVQAAGVGIVIAWQFVVCGGYPGTERQSGQCYHHLHEGLVHLAHSSSVLDELGRQADKGFDKADFAAIVRNTRENRELQAALASIRRARATADAGLRRTWRPYTEFHAIRYVSDAFLVSMDVFQVRVPRLFDAVQRHDDVMKLMNDICGQEDAKTSEVIATVSDPQVQAALDELLREATSCNEGVDGLYGLLPGWSQTLLRKHVRVRRFFSLMEATFWVFRNYAQIKQTYGRDTIVVCRSEVVLRFPEGSAGVLREIPQGSVRARFDKSIWLAPSVPPEIRRSMPRPSAPASRPASRPVERAPATAPARPAAENSREKPRQ